MQTEHFLLGMGGSAVVSARQGVPANAPADGDAERNETSKRPANGSPNPRPSPFVPQRLRNKTGAMGMFGAAKRG